MNRMMNTVINLPRIAWQVAGEAGAAPVVAEPPTVEATGATPAVPAEPAAGEAAGDTPSLLSMQDAPEPLTAEAIKFPEGVEAAPEAVASFLDIMNDSTLSRAELAQKLVDYQVSTQTAANEAGEAAALKLWGDTQSQWQAEAKGLPEIGGDALPQTLATIKRGLAAVGADKATFEALDLTGAGNHPAIIKILHALTKPLSEGGPVTGSPPSGKLTQAERMYPGRTD